MIAFVVTLRATTAMFELVMPLTFGVTGMSEDMQVYSALGTGFFVAPFTGVTAAHVVRGFWDKLEMPWKQGKYPKRPVEAAFELAAVQQVYQKNSLLVAHWSITGATPLDYTDIGFLNLVPKREVAEQFLWPKPFPELELLPPILGSKVWAFGYSGMTHSHTPGEAAVDITAEPTLTEGEVTGHFPLGRGTWRFPQFEVSCCFKPGMSGGPLIHEGRICGVISYGPELEGGIPGPSFAAALWPLLASEGKSSVDPRIVTNPALQMLERRRIPHPGETHSSRSVRHA